jgi:hypothetical protein
LQILLNGEVYATDAKTLDELCARLGFAEGVVTDADGAVVATATSTLLVFDL